LLPFRKGRQSQVEHAREAAEKAYDLSSPLSRECRLLAEAHYRRATGDLDKAIAAYDTLFRLFPDNIEYGLRLAGAQVLAEKGKDAFRTLGQIRKLPSALANDPCVDLAEAHATHSLGDYARSEAAAARSAERAKQLGARLLYANARHDQCWALGRLGKIDDALIRCDESKKIFADAHDENSVANLLNSSAAYLQDQGKLELAKSQYQQALSIFRAMDDPGGVNIVLNNLAIVNRRLGDRVTARQMYQESIALSRRIGDKDTEILALGNLSALLQFGGRATVRAGDSRGAARNLPRDFEQR
jgi:eukaryotic-like serine/threonine-protein kinase